MAERDNTQIAREVIGAWNAHDPEVLVKLLAETYVSESDTLPAPVRGHDGARQFMQIYVGAFPDLRLDIEQILASGDHVVMRWHAIGTQQGELMGIQPTNRRVETHGCTVTEYANGRVAREWMYGCTGTPAASFANSVFCRIQPKWPPHADKEYRTASVESLGARGV